MSGVPSLPIKTHLSQPYHNWWGLKAMKNKFACGYQVKVGEMAPPHERSLFQGTWAWFPPSSQLSIIPAPGGSDASMGTCARVHPSLPLNKRIHSSQCGASQLQGEAHPHHTWGTAMVAHSWISHEHKVGQTLSFGKNKLGSSSGRVRPAQAVRGILRGHCHSAAHSIR